MVLAVTRGGIAGTGWRVSVHLAELGASCYGFQTVAVNPAVFVGYRRICYALTRREARPTCWSGGIIKLINWSQHAVGFSQMVICYLR